MKESKDKFSPDQISYYFKKNIGILIVITVSGIIYNAGLLMSPVLEGRLAETLLNVTGGRSPFSAMVRTALIYLAVIFTVQLTRAIKRLTVRILGNSINRDMKISVFSGLLSIPRNELLNEGAGDGMTKALSDVDATTEGIRKSVTEIFDTGVFLISYSVLMFIYDWRISLIFLIFPPISYITSNALKKTVADKTGKARKALSRINEASLDRIGSAETYRIFSAEDGADANYEKLLSEYEKKNRSAEALIAALPSIYEIISIAGICLVIYFGARNVSGSGWTDWTIATFTAYISAALKLAVKSSKAAKLFNSIGKASVSWNSIKPVLKKVEFPKKLKVPDDISIVLDDVSFSYPGKSILFSSLSFSAEKGEIIGITGGIASGKTTIGKILLGEEPYSGSIKINGKELKDYSETEIQSLVSYLGHDPELFSFSVSDNILMGDAGNPDIFLRLTELSGELNSGLEVGSDGTRLSGGQRQRLALARTIAHMKRIIILDDPFSALDNNTEKKIFENIRMQCRSSIVIIFSHRLNIFPYLDNVICLDNGHAIEGKHEELIVRSAYYRELFSISEGAL